MSDKFYWPARVRMMDGEVDIGSHVKKAIEQFAKTLRIDVSGDLGDFFVPGHRSKFDGKPGLFISSKDDDEIFFSFGDPTFFGKLVTLDKVCNLFCDEIREGFADRDVVAEAFESAAAKIRKISPQ